MKKYKYLNEILEICKNNHLTAEDIFIELKKTYPKVWIATVYRSINYLLKQGKLRKVANIWGKIYYETFVNFHLHLIDETTGEIIDLSEEDIKISKNLKEKLLHVSNINIFGKIKKQ